METESVGMSYHVLLCEYIAGELERVVDREADIVSAIMKVYKQTGRERDDIYPSCTLVVDNNNRQVSIGGVLLSDRDLRDILLSVSGRGLLLDMEGYTGQVPTWLYEGALVPAGYVGKMPKSVP